MLRFTASLNCGIKQEYVQICALHLCPNISCDGGPLSAYTVTVFSVHFHLQISAPSSRSALTASPVLRTLSPFPVCMCCGCLTKRLMQRLPARCGRKRCVSESKHFSPTSTTLHIHVFSLVNCIVIGKIAPIVLTTMLSLEQSCLLHCQRHCHWCTHNYCIVIGALTSAVFPCCKQYVFRFPR